MVVDPCQVRELRRLLGRKNVEGGGKGDIYSKEMKLMRKLLIYRDFGWLAYEMSNSDVLLGHLC